MVFFSLAGLFQSCLILAKIHDSRKLYGNNGEKKAQKDFKHRKDQSNNDDPIYTLTCLQYFRDSEGKIFKNRPLGVKDVAFSNWRSLQDSFVSSFRSMSLIGNEKDSNILQRNKKSLYTILNELKVNGYKCPAFELSSRNSSELSSYILNSECSPNCLLDDLDKPSPSYLIKTIAQQNTRSQFILDYMTSRATEYCKEQSNMLGPGSPIFQKSIFSPWMGASTKSTNSRSLYFQTLNALYQGKVSTSVSKLEKMGIKGKISTQRIGKSLQRVSLGFNSYCMQRASIEFSLGSIRLQKDICRITGKHESPCAQCGIYESLYSADAHIKRNMYRHILLDCVPARYLLQYVKALSFRTLGKIFDFSLETLLLNELPQNIVKGIPRDKLRCFYSILNSYKATIYSTYYIRSPFTSGQSLLYRFNLNLQTSLKICKSLDYIHLPKYSFYSFQSYAEIKKIVMAETKSDRREDQNFRKRYNLPKNTRDQPNISKQRKNNKNKNNVKKISKQKEMFMMINTLKSVPKKHFTRNGELNISKLNQ